MPAYNVNTLIELEEDRNIITPSINKTLIKIYTDIIKGTPKMKPSYYNFDDLKPFQRVHVYSPLSNKIHYGIVAQNVDEKFIVYPPNHNNGLVVSYDPKSAFKHNGGYKIVAVYEAPTNTTAAFDPQRYGELVWMDDTEERKEKLKELQERESKVLEELASIKAELRELED